VAPGSADIVDEVSSWPGVTLERGRFGSARFMVGRRELGHLHGSATLDVPLPRRVKEELIGRGDAEVHPFAPADSGWVRIGVEAAADRERALALLRERYDHALELRARRGTAVEPTA
jgi:hypothetical protein